MIVNDTISMYKNGKITMHKKSIWIYLKIYSFLLYYVINAKEEVKYYAVMYEKLFENYLKALENKDLANDI